MSSKMKLVLSSILYVIVLLATIWCKLVSSAGSDIALALTVFTTLLVALVVFQTDVLVEAPPPHVDPKNPTPDEKENAWKNKKARAVMLLYHLLLFVAITVLPFEDAPRISLYVLITLVLIELCAIAVKSFPDYEKRQVEGLESIMKKGEKILPYLVGALIVVALWQKYDGKGFFTAAYSSASSYVNSMEDQRSRDNVNCAPKWGELFRKNLAARGTSHADDLDGDQRVILSAEPYAQPPAQTTSTTGSPFIASINEWRKPVDFVAGRTNSLALSPDSFIDISSPENAVFLNVRASASGAGQDLVLENGVCERRDVDYVCRGAWHQGNVCGTYTMGVQSTGATAQLFANVDGDTIRVCQFTIVVQQ